MKISEMAKQLKCMYERGEYDPDQYLEYEEYLALDPSERCSLHGHSSYEPDVNDDEEGGYEYEVETNC